ncbi:effector binding domain-containing protein [Peribacillus aracenensis]|uniref:effector binding domain-containing protein n=1 Tax=Peribacillus aracenensis TaxID=2976708 RepID=UPI0021A6C1C5|nr:hypothetical protein [Peribacillus sp. BBB004]
MIGETRTNDFSDKEIFEKIGSLWSKANDHDIENDLKYGIYHQYESNYRGDYTLAIVTETPISNEKLVIPDQEYVLFECFQDEQSVEKTW